MCFAALRSVIVVEIARVGDSCGFVVPRMDYIEERETLFRWAAALGEEGKAAYVHTNNAASLDALPGLDVARAATEAEARAHSSTSRKIQRCSAGVLLRT